MDIKEITYEINGAVFEVNRMVDRFHPSMVLVKR